VNTETIKPEGSRGATYVAIAVAIGLVVLSFLYALMDRNVPGSSRGIVSARIVPIAPRVSGEVIRVHVADDAVVEAGAALFSIDPRPFELAVRQAEADLTTAMQSVDASSAALVAAQAAVTRARASLNNTRAQSERVFRLKERGLVSAADVDDARAAVDDAKAGLESAQAQLESARAQLGSEGQDNPAIQGAQARLEQAQYDLASTTVEAPYFGVVTNVTLAEGRFIAAGEPALTFIDAGAAWITVDFRENQLGKVDVGDPARILFDAVPGRIFDARVQSVAWGINPGRDVREGLVVSKPDNRWFEPARRIPVRLELEGGVEAWPRAVPVGGKVHAIVLAEKGNGVLVWIARVSQRLRSWFSFLH
jgi:multidrug resistance efflux pump